MAKRLVTCGTCGGSGGWWDYGNGKKGAPPKKWVKCHACAGRGTVEVEVK